MPRPPADAILRARILLPVHRPPIENGAVCIVGGHVVAAGKWSSIRRTGSGPVLDLGERILLPGLVNAHCHLDYTHMAAQFPPQRSFCDWIKLITTEKGSWRMDDFARSWDAGAGMLVRNGVTTVVDVESVPQLLPEAWNRTPLRVFSLLEMTGIRSRRDPRGILFEALARMRALSRHERCRVGLAPHAPYSTLPQLLQLSAAAARKRRCLITAHISESQAEFDMFLRARGDMFEWIRRSHRDMSDCGIRSPIQHLEANGILGPNLIAVHANYLAPGDAGLLARHRVSVVHCPKSHDFFRHQAFPGKALARAGVNLCLGTDSMASVRKHPARHLELNLFQEMNLFATTHPGMKPGTILEMATVNGAHALGMVGKLGVLRAGAFADLVAIPFSGAPQEACAAVVHHPGSVDASMIDGRWAIQPG
jgi:cytosine/adenosine deaminase-related metal-dependent hydrolase